jgi:hypothetical protein
VHAVAKRTNVEVPQHKGEDEDGVPDELFSVRFDQSREPAIDELCRKHGLRREGDW